MARHGLHAALEGRRALLRRLRQRLAAAPWTRQAGRTLHRWAQRNFASGGALLDPPPGPWPPLAPGTRPGRAGHPLEDTGRLRRSLRLRAVPGAEELAFTAPYAATHHEGRGVPRRALLPSAAQAERLLQPGLQATLEDALRQAGLEASGSGGQHPGPPGGGA